MQDLNDNLLINCLPLTHTSHHSPSLSLSFPHTHTINALPMSRKLVLSFSFFPIAISLSFSLFFEHRYRCDSSCRPPGTLLGRHCGHRCGWSPSAALHCGSAVLHNGTHGCHGRHVPQGQAIAIGN